MPTSLNSTQTVYGGYVTLGIPELPGAEERAANLQYHYRQAPSKPGHHFSTHPPTSGANGSQALRDYSLATFMRASNSTPLSSSLSAQEIEAAHRARVATQITALQRHLP
ncbi:hypothetical protein F4803DRAFT_445037 [Xylaria telfairii]|nr:hypothetical protein F4803DRAFT_445037 [Xylaria telfairii]